MRTVGPLETDADYAYLRHVGGALDSAMLAGGTLLVDGGTTIWQSDHPLTMSLLFGDPMVLGTISADAFLAGTRLDFFGRQIAWATLDGSPIVFLNANGFGRVTLPAAGELVVNFQTVPEPASVVLAIAAVLTLASVRALVARRGV